MRTRLNRSSTYYVVVTTPQHCCHWTPYIWWLFSVYQLITYYPSGTQFFPFWTLNLVNLEVTYAAVAQKYSTMRCTTYLPQGRAFSVRPYQVCHHCDHCHATPLVWLGHTHLTPYAVLSRPYMLGFILMPNYKVFLGPIPLRVWHSVLWTVLMVHCHGISVYVMHC